MMNSQMTSALPLLQLLAVAGMAAGTSEATVVTIAGDLGRTAHAPAPAVPAVFDTLTAWSPAVFDVHPLPTVSDHRPRVALSRATEISWRTVL